MQNYTAMYCCSFIYRGGVLCLVLNELGMSQYDGTSVYYENNKRCLHMTQYQKPTKNTRHIDLRHFAVVDWVSQDLLLIKKISTHDNSSDTLTKSLGKTLFHRHTDTT